MEAPVIRSRILVVALLLFVTGSALAWNRTYRRATTPAPALPGADRYMAMEHGGRIVSQVPARPAAQQRPPARPVENRIIPTPPPQPDPPATPTARKVEVRKGDSLHRVAKRALGDALRWREIAEMNDLRVPYTIHPGQTLTVPGR